MPDTPHRAKVLLGVELEPVVDVAVEVHGELRQPRNAAMDVYTEMAAVVHRERAGDAEVAIEPRVVEDPAVDLDVELLPADVAVVGARLDAQARRVGMGAGETERRDGVSARRSPPGDDAAALDHEPGRR